MPVPESVRAAYSKVEHLLIDLEGYVDETLQRYCSANRYLFFGRRKTYESLAEKLEGGRIDAWSSIDDLYACTIVVPTIEHEVDVVKKLEQYFERVEVRSRATVKTAPEVFRFSATRFYGRLREDAALARPPGVGEITFEVQIATAFEYAWATVTHDLVYKGDDVDWGKLRLAAQLKAAVEQIEMVIGAFSAASSAIPASSWPEVDIKRKIVTEFRTMISDGIISPTLEPASWRRFGENVLALVKSYDRNPGTTAASVDRLIDGVRSAWVKDGSPACPTAGTLFQLVLGFIASKEAVGNLAKFRVVESAELRDLYGVEVLPIKFVFDLPQMSGSELESPD